MLKFWVEKSIREKRQFDKFVKTKERMFMINRMNRLSCHHSVSLVNTLNLSNLSVMLHYNDVMLAVYRLQKIDEPLNFSWFFNLVFLPFLILFCVILSALIILFLVFLPSPLPFIPLLSSFRYIHVVLNNRLSSHFFHTRLSHSFVSFYLIATTRSLVDND